MSLDIAVPSQYAFMPVSFTVTNGNAAKILTEPLVAGGGVMGVPVNANLLGGGRIIDMIATSTDGTNRDLQIYEGKLALTVASGLGTVSITGTNTLNITTGDLRTIGFRVGQQIMAFAATNTAPIGSEGLLGVITAVNQLSLTLSTPAAWTNETLANGVRIFMVAQHIRTTVTANAGNSTSVGNITIVANTNDNAVDRTGAYVSGDEVYIGAIPIGVTMSALPAAVSVRAKLAVF